jgi:predicted DNA-binding transcriptional regulator AlpA
MSDAQRERLARNEQVATDSSPGFLPAGQTVALPSAQAIDEIVSRLLTDSEAATMLRMSIAWFHKRMKRENFLNKIKIGRRVYYDKADIEDYINRSRESAA